MNVKNDPINQAIKQDPLTVARALESSTAFTMETAEKQFNEAVEFFKTAIRAHQEAVATVAILEMRQQAWHEAQQAKKGGAN